MKADTRTALIVPAYQPDQSLVALLDALKGDGYSLIIVVNDGSDSRLLPIFEQAAKRKNIIVLTHAVNLGKGDALKTAFNYILTQCPEIENIVTVDADGQHLPEDILKVAQILAAAPRTLCLGVRTLSKNTPLKSYFGNYMTRQIFRFLMGKKVSDTQTGLRGIQRWMLPSMLSLRGYRYEFELEMLILACQKNWPIKEVPISSVYINGNKGSHFNPVLDSLRIYFVFLRFSILSVLTALIDNLVFLIGYRFTRYIFLATVIGRIGAGSFNFVLGKKLVFQSKGDTLPQALSYVTLVIVLMTISYGLVTLAVRVLGFGVFGSKILAESLLFFASFSAQRVFVFRNRELESSEVEALS